MSSFLLLIGALLAVPLGSTAAIYLARWRASGATPDCSIQSDRRVAAGAFAAECAATAVAMASWLLSPLPSPSPGSGGTRGIAILLPEAGLAAASFWLLGRRLQRSGWDYVVGTCHTRPTELETALGEIDQCMQRVRGSNRRVAIIGHGSGGLVARYYLRQRPGAEIGRLVTLGSAHQGTRSPLPGLRLLRPGSRFLRQLAEIDHLPRPFDAIAIHSAFDAWLIPPDRAHYPGAFNIELLGVGHFSLLTSRRVYRLMLENLDADLPTPGVRR